MLILEPCALLRRRSSRAISSIRLRASQPLRQYIPISAATHTGEQNMQATSKTIGIGILGLVASLLVSSRLKGQPDEPPVKRQTSATKPSARFGKAHAAAPNRALVNSIQMPGQPQLQRAQAFGFDSITALPVPSNKGTVLQIITPVQGEMAFFLRRFVEKFLHDDPQPASRSAHFSWIPVTTRLHRIGWHGAIVGVQPQIDRSVIVTIKIQPYLFANSRRSAIIDFVHEKYLVSNGVFTLIDTDAANNEGHFHGFPLGDP